VIGGSLAMLDPFGLEIVGRGGYDPNRSTGKEIVPMTPLSHRTIEANGIRMYLTEQGTGPLVVLCHGFPESWYSWRHQLTALAEAGFHVVAPDMRGYGRTDRPDEIDQYTLLHLVGDMVGLLDALGAEQAVIAGHDWGAPVAWHAALLRPDRFRAVIGLSGPYRPRGKVRPSTVMPQSEDAAFYQLYFQTPGAAETEFERDVRHTIRTILYSLSGDAPPREGSVTASGNAGMVHRQGGFLARMASPASLPRWITEADVDLYAAEFSRTGFRGGLNWYRNIDRNWELLAPFAGAPVIVPALYIAGEYDVVLAFAGIAEAIRNLSSFVPRLRGTIILPGCGHWTQQERAAEINGAIIDFLRGL
jgi:pimeloyl-ACP methyl ester carboxylesterase